jgi:hypothetical protein
LLRFSTAALAVCAGFVACALNPGVDLPKSDSVGSVGGTTAQPGTGGTGQGGSSGSAGTAPTGTGAQSSGGAVGTGGSVASSGAGGSGTSSAGTSNDAGAEAGGESGGEAGAAGSGDVGATPYANVTAVMTSGSDGAYTFDTSVESADIDCTQFANWWEVLGEDGTLLYRRILEHSHTDENGSSDANAPGNTFTRSGGPVPITADVVVLVRAHMSTGGYNGMVMRGSVTDGFTDAPEIGGDFAAGVEGADPQPTGCQF